MYTFKRKGKHCICKFKLKPSNQFLSLHGTRCFREHSSQDVDRTVATFLRNLENVSTLEDSREDVPALPVFQCPHTKLIIELEGEFFLPMHDLVLYQGGHTILGHALGGRGGNFSKQMVYLSPHPYQNQVSTIHNRRMFIFYLYYHMCNA